MAGKSLSGMTADAAMPPCNIGDTGSVRRGRRGDDVHFAASPSVVSISSFSSCAIQWMKI